MQTLQFVRALQQIVSRLQVKEMRAVLAPFLASGQVVAIPDDKKAKFSTLYAQSIAGASQLELDPDVKRVMDALRVSDIYAPPLIGKMFGVFNAAPTSQAIWANPENFSLFFSFVNMLHWLETMSDGTTSLLETDRLKVATPESGVVEMEIVSDEGKGVEAIRLQEFFSSLIKLHSQLARLLKVENSHLEVVYADSGSVVIGVSMAATVANKLKELFWEIWKEVKYGPYERLDRKSDSLMKVLTVTKEIQAQIESKALSEEDGQNLKHRIVHDALSVIGVGAMLPAEKTADQPEQRKLLMEHRTKLLGPGGPVAGEAIAKDSGAEG
jgi:hypothetical protein